MLKHMLFAEGINRDHRSSPAKGRDRENDYHSAEQACFSLMQSSFILAQIGIA